MEALPLVLYVAMTTAVVVCSYALSVWAGFESGAIRWLATTVGSLSTIVAAGLFLGIGGS